jgi:hypothetical protein
MDIEEFYDGDPRRREGEDVSYGLNWSDAAQPHRRFDLYWNDGSLELYLMAKPIEGFPAAETMQNALTGWVGVSLRDDWRELEVIEHRIVGAAEHLIHPGQVQAKTGQASPRYDPDQIKDVLTQQIEVEVLGTVADQAEADRILEGWQEAMKEAGSIAWLRTRLSQEEVHP